MWSSGRAWWVVRTFIHVRARTTGPAGHDQQTVLRVAIELFNRQGYDAASMGDLARELG